MLAFLTRIVLVLRSRLDSRASREAEILVLRQQLMVLGRKSRKRVRLRNIDRLILIWLYRIFPSVLDAIVVVKPETVIRWHRRGFQAYWHWKSRRLGGRPKIDSEARDLIRRMNRENPLWGAPRIHGELLMLGIEVAESTVGRYIVRSRRPPSQGWKTFLRNHAAGIASIDLFVVRTISFKLLYGLVILGHARRRIVTIGVTTNPTAEWIANQLTDAFPWDEAPRHLTRDRDGAYGPAYLRRVHAMGIRDHPTAPRSPWQNGHVERLIGSIRRECLDHFVVFGEAHLRRVLKAYASYYNEVRTHLSLNKDAPHSRGAQPVGPIAALPLLGGLHHQYVRVEFCLGTGCSARTTPWI
jgi:transposase InsO family protein